MPSHLEAGSVQMGMVIRRFFVSSAPLLLPNLSPSPISGTVFTKAESFLNNLCDFPHSPGSGIFRPLPSCLGGRGSTLSPDPGGSPLSPSLSS